MHDVGGLFFARRFYERLLAGAEINTSAVAHALDHAVVELPGAAGVGGDVRAQVCVVIGRSDLLEAEECSFGCASGMMAVRTSAIRASRRVSDLWDL
jgi:hypothetical protein